MAQKSVKDLIVLNEKCVEPALEEQAVQLQAQLQQLMTDHQEGQERSEVQRLRYGSVNLPKLKIPSFNSDTLRSFEVWDSLKPQLIKIILNQALKN